MLAEPNGICVVDRRVLWRHSLEAALASSWPEASVNSLDAVLGEPAVDRDAVAAALLLGGMGLSSNAALREDFVAIEKSLPGVPILIVTDDFDARDVTEAMQLGARGYLASSVSMELLIQCLRLLMIGGTAFPPVMATAVADAAPGALSDSRSRPDTNLAIDFFTPREIEVLGGLGEGKPNKIIAYELKICETTVKVHMRHIMRKLGATNRTHAALLASEMLSGPDQQADKNSRTSLNLAS
ncbi:MAG: response regulator transcription factor [Geminicoccaceae bacterium]